MNKDATNDVNKLLEKIPVNIRPDITNVFSLLLEYGASYLKERQMTKREIARYNVLKDVLITDINRKHDLYVKIFADLFKERENVINKYFELIDKGMKEQNNEVILSGLSNLSNVVASSPFANIGELKGLLESNKLIEL